MTYQDMAPQGEALTARESFLHRVWTDDAFCADLKADPKAVLAAMGGEVPNDVQIKVVQDSDRVKYLHIPAAPPEGEIGDDELLGANAGFTSPISWGAVVSFVGTATFIISVETTK